MGKSVKSFLLVGINTFESKILSVLGNHILLNTFYEHFNLKIKFETEIRFLNHKKIDKIPYISNY